MIDRAFVAGVNSLFIGVGLNEDHKHGKAELENVRPFHTVLFSIVNLGRIIVGFPMHLVNRVNDLACMFKIDKGDVVFIRDYKIPGLDISMSDEVLIMKIVEAFRYLGT